LLIEGGRQTPATPPGCWSNLGREQHNYSVAPMRRAEPQRLSSRVVCFVLLAPLFVLVGCGPIGSTLEEDTLRDQANNLKDRGPVGTVNRVVDGDSVEVTHAVDGLTEVRLISVDTLKQRIRVRACSPMVRRPPASPCLLRREMGVHYACNIEQPVRARMEERLLSLRG